MTLLICSTETVFFIINENSIDIKKLLKISDFSPFTFYRINFFILNFEQFLLLPLKKHFLDIESFLLSHLIWTDLNFISIDIEKDKTLIPVFNRLVHYMSN